MQLREQLHEKEKNYIKLKKIIEKSMTEHLDGRLAINKRRNKCEYYHVLHDEKSGKTRKIYLGKNKINLVKKLAQRQYYLKVKSLIDKRLKQLRNLLKDYEDNEIENIYKNLKTERKALIYPLVLTYEEKLKQWIKEDYDKKSFSNTDVVILTKKGERVRSKTEKIMADKFYDMGIEYKYERPIYLKNGARLYPDFTFLSPITGQEIYWEHHGMLDNPNYATNTIKKIILYEQNGIYRGENLIITCETSKFNLDYNWVDILIKRHLKR